MMSRAGEPSAETLQVPLQGRSNVPQLGRPRGTRPAAGFVRFLYRPPDFLAMKLKRSHMCGSLRLPHAGQTVTVNGWVNTYRDQGKGLIFIVIPPKKETWALQIMI